MIDNPYTNRSALRTFDDFFGRRRELNDIASAIHRGACLSLVGERRVGKTSVLFALRWKEIRKRLQIPSNLRFVFIDAQYLVDAEESDVVEYMLDQISLETGTRTRGGTRELLRRVSHELAGDTSPQRIAVLIDEVDVLSHSRKISPKFFSFLRAWTEAFQIPFVIASREGSIDTLVEADGAGSPFWNIFRPLYIGPLDSLEAEDLVRTPAARMRQPFTDREVAHALALGGYQPFFLQIACFHLFAAKAEGAIDDFTGATQAFRSESCPHLQYLLNRLSPVERRALVGLEMGQPVDPRIMAELMRKGVVVDRPVRPFCGVLREILEPPAVVGLDSKSFAKRASDLLFG